MHVVLRVGLGLLAIWLVPVAFFADWRDALEAGACDGDGPVRSPFEPFANCPDPPAQWIAAAVISFFLLLAFGLAHVAVRGGRP